MGRLLLRAVHRRRSLHRGYAEHRRSECYILLSFPGKRYMRFQIRKFWFGRQQCAHIRELRVYNQFTSRTVQGYSKISGTDLGTKFMNEAKNLLALEGDKASITTVQGLAILFTVTAYRGTDRLGLVSGPNENLFPVLLPSGFSFSIVD